MYLCIYFYFGYVQLTSAINVEIKIKRSDKIWGEKTAKFDLVGSPGLNMTVSMATVGYLITTSPFMGPPVLD